MERQTYRPPIVIKRNPNRVLVYVEGGVVQRIMATRPDEIKVQLFDVDNLRADGKSSAEIERMFLIATKYKKSVAF